ncbi:hypothetical protein ACFYO5_24725 [Streptomyces sp. NPDC006259]|uniref:hypothetical protein n=1 Tax=Streptomyces sp. NPDC006259 TaxID=3364740 RepID=UPI0036A678A7
MKPPLGPTALARWTGWWAVVTLAFWLLGRTGDQRPSLLGCAATAVFAIVVGELGDRWRRRRARRRAARPSAGPGRSPG